MNQPGNALMQYAETSIAEGSLSFSFASRLFGGRIHRRVIRLYAWCRHVDNCVDGLPQTASPEERERLLAEIEEESFGSPGIARHPAMQALHHLREELEFPEEPARELIKGMAMDLQGARYQTQDDLLLYCHRVAGVVGLMMSHLMEVRDRNAHRHALDLGMAMQLTNIARDVAEDAAMGRIYLPRAWLCKAGIPEGADLLHPVFRPALVAVVERALRLADQLYQSGDAGLKYLPLRCALAVAVAREIYADIGREVRKRQGEAWRQRVWIPWPRKVVLACRGIGRVLATLPYRLQRVLRLSRTEKRGLLHEQR